VWRYRNQVLGCLEDKQERLTGCSLSAVEVGGQYLFTSPLEAIQQLFKVDQITNLGPNYNVAPTHEMSIVRRKKGDRRNEPPPVGACSHISIIEPNRRDQIANTDLHMSTVMARQTGGLKNM